SALPVRGPTCLSGPATGPSRHRPSPRAAVSRRGSSTVVRAASPVAGVAVKAVVAVGRTRRSRRIQHPGPRAPLRELAEARLLRAGLRELVLAAEQEQARVLVRG